MRCANTAQSKIILATYRNNSGINSCESGLYLLLGACMGCVRAGSVFSRSCRIIIINQESGFSLVTCIFAFKLTTNLICRI